jgi:hypothetical protein
MTTLPPVLPVLAAGADVVLDELGELDELPQAVATMDTVANSVTHVKRFIDTLRSQFEDRQPVAG